MTNETTNSSPLLVVGLDRKVSRIPAPIVYTLRRCRKDDTLYGPSHGSSDGNVTLCGIETDHHWWIVTNAFNGLVTCKKCEKVANVKVRGPEAALSPEAPSRLPGSAAGRSERG